MSMVFRILFFFLIVYLLDQYTAVNSTFISLLYILTWVYAGFLIIKNYGGREKTVENVPFNAPVSKPEVVNSAPDKKRSYTGLIVVIMLILAVVFFKFLGIISVNFFQFMNRLLHVTSLTSAVTLWAISGLFVGMIYGALVAWKKYRLHFTIIIVPVAALAVFIIAMLFLNDPLKPSPELVSVSEDASRFVSVRSSGYLPAFKLTSFSDSNLVDNNDKTTWIENAKNAGIGERIEFNFNTVVHMDKYRNFVCTGINIRNGYARSEKLWASHNRLRDFSVLLNGQVMGNFTAGNYNHREVIALRPFAVKFSDVISIRINSVYYGNRYFKLTAITELVPVVEYIQ